MYALSWISARQCVCFAIEEVFSLHFDRGRMEFASCTKLQYRMQAEANTYKHSPIMRCTFCAAAGILYRPQVMGNMHPQDTSIAIWSMQHAYLVEVIGVTAR